MILADSFSESDKVDLNKLRTFAAVAERGGVSPAAATLALTRSAVSQSLAGARVVARRAALRPRRAAARADPGRPHARAPLRPRARGAARARSRSWSNDEREVRGVVRLGLFLGASRAQVARASSRRFAAAHPERPGEAQLTARTRSCASCCSRTGSTSRSRSCPATPRSRGSARALLFRQDARARLARAAARGAPAPSWIASSAFVDYYPVEPADPALARATTSRASASLPTCASGPRPRTWRSSSRCAGAGAAVVPRALAEPLVRAGRLHEIRGGRPELATRSGSRSPRAPGAARRSGVPRDARRRARSGA